MPHWVRARAVFRAPLDAFRLGRIFDPDEVNLMPPVQPLQRLQGSDLAAARRRMEKVRLHPQNFHGAPDAGAAGAEALDAAVPGPGAPNRAAKDSRQRSAPRPVKKISPQISRFS